MMAARETKLNFALPDAAVPPIDSPEKKLFRGFAGGCACARRVGAASVWAGDERVAEGVE
jgi:hypothetical protein